MKIPPRELQCLRLVCLGFTNKEIAQRMGNSQKTVEKHRNTTYWRLGCNTAIGLLRISLRKGLITMEEFLACEHGERDIRQRPKP